MEFIRENFLTQLLHYRRNFFYDDNGMNFSIIFEKHNSRDYVFHADFFDTDIVAAENFIRSLKNCYVDFDCISVWFEECNIDNIPDGYKVSFE